MPALLEEYGVLVERRWQEQTFSAHWLDEVEADTAAIANELERRTTPAKVEQPNLVAATYVRHTVDRLTAETMAGAGLDDLGLLPPAVDHRPTGGVGTHGGGRRGC